jgi:hypothetical protein
MRRFILGVAISIACLSPGLASASDQETAQRIADTLRQSGRLADYSIGVKYQGGTAWLLGRVSSADQMATAVQMAERMPEVTSVVNNLEIKSSGHRPAGAKQPVVRAAASRSNRTVVRLPEQTADEHVQPAAGEVSFPDHLGTGQRDTLGALDQGSRGPSVRRASQTSGRMAPMPLGQQLQNTPTLAPAPQGYHQLAQAAPGSFPGQVHQAPYQAGTEGGLHPLAQQAPFQGPPVPAGVRQGRGVPLGQPVTPGMTRAAGYQMVAAGGGGAMPSHTEAVPGGAAPAYYDQPHMPNYAWPSYAAYPNYAGLTYPKQYSPTAWPYIGPFYPYPQVPLGWRKVTLEWDDGWWFLDFDDRRCH